MYENGYINIDSLSYKKKPIEVKERIQNIFSGADYFYEEIRKYLYSEYGKEKMFSEGLIVKTSIDTNLQSIAEQSLINGLLNYEKNLIQLFLHQLKVLVSSKKFYQL